MQGTREPGSVGGQGPGVLGQGPTEAEKNIREGGLAPEGPGAADIGGKSARTGGG